MLHKVPFIKPMARTLAKIPPEGSESIHEVKFDGWRAELHIDRGEATTAPTSPSASAPLRHTLSSIPFKSGIIDCELIACNETGMPDFRTLMEQGFSRRARKCASKGIVSKRRESPYTSGPTRDWLKIKTKAWRAANTDRFELLHKSAR